MSGLSHHPGKVAQGQLCRGFESRPLRQIKKGPQGSFFIWKKWKVNWFEMTVYLRTPVDTITGSKKRYGCVLGHLWK